MGSGGFVKKWDFCAEKVNPALWREALCFGLRKVENGGERRGRRGVDAKQAKAACFNLAAERVGRTGDDCTVFWGEAGSIICDEAGTMGNQAQRQGGFARARGASD